MRIRCHAQRQHIIHSLDTLLYQLFTLSFFLSPRVWPLICRSATQFQFSRPRELDPKRSLRFWFFLILLFNTSSLWSHAAEGAAVGRAVVLDFVGMAHVPSKMQLLFLDLLIVFLQMLLTTIAYETSFILESPDDTLDLLLPNTPISSATSPSSYASLPTEEATVEEIEASSSKSRIQTDSSYVIDLRLSAVLERLRHPAPPPPERESGLPMPNMARASLPHLSRGLRMIFDSRRASIERAAGTQTTEERETDASRRVPGGMDNDDGG